MDAVSYSLASKQAQRIEKFIENPDSASGIVTVPKVIASGETITIPAGRIAVLPNVQVDGTLNVEGDVFIPSGATFGDLESQIALKADTSYVNNKYSGFKNYIINGGFDIWQRGTNISGISLDSAYRADRWFFRTSPTGATNLTTKKNYSSSVGTYLEYTYTSSMNGHYFRQHIENPVQFSNKTMTLSITVYNCSIKTNFHPILLVHDGTSDVFILPLGKMFTTHTEVLPEGIRYSSTFTVPDLSSYNLTSLSSFFSIGFYTDWIGTGTFRFGKVQLEEGSVATPFEQRPIGLELSLCQRYLPSSTGFYSGHAATTNEVYLSVPTMVVPRVTPTGITYSAGGTVYYTNTSSPITAISLFAGNANGHHILKVNPTGSPLTIGQGVMVGLPPLFFTGCEL